MSSLRIPLRRTALRPSTRLLLPRTTSARTFLNTTQRKADSRDEKWYEPNDGGKFKDRAKDTQKSNDTGYKLDGTSTVNSSRTLMYIGGITAVLAAVYFVGLAKPDKAVATDLKYDTDAVKRHTGSDRQRVGGPERSEK